ncbi:MAG: DUF4760 domain-containing protein [Proteobacteria bacterium]|nr:DUF4760 domain-containing protein [Pseudomonadota bacterium]
MTNYEVASLVIQGVGSASVAAALIFAGIQIRTMWKSHAEDHLWKRRKAAQDATLLYVQRVGGTENLQQAFDYIDRKDPISLEKIQAKFSADATLKSRLHKLLNYFESLARGVSTKIYDERIIQVAWDGPMVRTMYKFSAYIENRRDTVSPDAWRELESVVTRWKADGSRSDLARSYETLGS